MAAGREQGRCKKRVIQNVSISRTEIVQVNKDLNIKYAHADNNTQAKFDKYGNIPR